MPDLEEPELKDALSSAGIDAVSISAVSDKYGPVYKVQSDTRTYFIKILSEGKGEFTSDIIDRELEIGFPAVTIVSADEYILIMDPVDGNPLSLSLPLSLLPGLWWKLRAPMTESVREIGRHLGKLHDGTSLGVRRVGWEGCRLGNRLELGESVSDYFDDESIATLESIFTDVKEVALPAARIHGDPTPHNLYVQFTSREANIIDFNFHKSVALEDLIVFESGIELMIARIPYARTSQTNALVNSFRSGYRETGVHESIPERELKQLKLVYYCHLLDKYADRGTIRTNPKTVIHSVDKPAIENNIRRFLSDL